MIRILVVQSGPQLRNAGDIAMPKNAKTSGKERLANAVSLRVLRLQEFDDGLSGCEFHKK